MNTQKVSDINPAQILAQYTNPGESLRGIGKSLGAQADSMETQRLREIELARQNRAEQRIIDDRTIELARQDRAEQRIIDDRALVEKNRQGLIKFGEIVAAGPQQTDWINPVFTKEAEAMSLEGLKEGTDEYNRRVALQEKAGRELAKVIEANYTDPRLRESRFGMYNRAMGAAGVVTPEMLAMIQQAGEAEDLARESKLTSLKSQQSKLSEDTDKTQLDAAKTMFVESGKDWRDSNNSKSGSGKSETEGSGSLKQDTYDKALEVAMGQYKADYVPKWMSSDATNLDTLNQYAAANNIDPDRMFALLRSKTSAGSDKNDISEKDVEQVIKELTQNPNKYTFKSTKQGVGSTGGIDRNTALAGNAYQNIVNQQIAKDRVQQAIITDEIRKANMSSEERRNEFARTLVAPIIAGNKVKQAVVPITTETNGSRQQTDTSTKKGTKEKVVKAVGGGLTDKGVLNAEATKSINDRLAEQGITKTIPTGTSPEEANRIVTNLMKDRKTISEDTKIPVNTNPNKMSEQMFGNYAPGMKVSELKDASGNYGDAKNFYEAKAAYEKLNHTPSILEKGWEGVKTLGRDLTVPGHMTTRIKKIEHEEGAAAAVSEMLLGSGPAAVASVIPIVAGAKGVVWGTKAAAALFNQLLARGVEKRAAEAMIKSGRLLPRFPKQIAVPKGGFAKHAAKESIVPLAMKP